MYSCNRFYNVCAFHKQTNSALLFPLRGYCKEGWRQKRSCAVLKYSAVPRRDTQMKCCSSTQVRHTSVDQQTAQTVVPWQKPVCIKVRAPSLHRLLIRACWQMLDPPRSLHSLLLRACWQILPLRTPCTGNRLLIRACWQIPCPTLRTPCTSSFAERALMASPLVLAFLEKSESKLVLSFLEKSGRTPAFFALPIN